MDRFGGACAGFFEAGTHLDPARCHNLDPDDGVDRAVEVLAGRQRPDGVIALWHNIAEGLKRAADKKNLVIGRDFELVGWSVEEIHETRFRQAFLPGPVPPAITWSARAMAETAMARLSERRENPDLEAITVKVPTALRTEEGTI